MTKTDETGSWTEGLVQVISQLDWLGYITVFGGGSGELSQLQITERGMAQAGSSNREAQPCSPSGHRSRSQRAIRQGG